MRAVRRLLDPAAESQPRPLAEIKQLRHGIGAVLRVQERVSECRFVSEIRRVAQQLLERMAAWQLPERGDEITNASVGRTDADPLQNSCSR